MSEVAQELSEFFDTLWGDQEGYVYLPNKDIKNPEDPVWTKIFFKWPEQKDNVIKYSLVTSAKGLEVFCAPAIFKETRATKDAVKGSYVLWADFDGNAPAEWPATLATLTQDSPTHVPPPTMRVQSSKEGNEHVYWRLESFCENIGQIEDRNRAIAYILRTDVSGWDCNQILRPPGTINHKRELPVTLRNIERDQSRSHYKLDSFKAIPAAIQLVDSSVDVENLPGIERIIAKYPWDEQHFALFMGTVEEGQRSHALMRIGYFCAEKGMTDTEMYAVLSNADQRWKKFVGRNDRHRRLLDIVNRARLKHPVGDSELNFRGLLGSDEGTTTGSTIIYNFKDFLNTDLKVEWVVEGLLEKGGFGLVAAMPGVGKTQFSLQLAISTALGIPFLGWNIPSKQKVLFLSLEMSHVSLKYITEIIAQGYTPEELEIINENVLIAPIGEAINLDRIEGIRFLESLIESYRPDGIVIDSMGKLSNKEISNEVVIKILNNQYIRLRKKFGCWLWFIHHNRKENGDNKKPTNLADIYGNQYITAEMTSCLILWKEKEKDAKGDRLVSCIPVKQRLSRERPPFVMERTEHLKFVERANTSTAEFIANLEESFKNDNTESPFNFS